MAAEVALTLAEIGEKAWTHMEKRKEHAGHAAALEEETAKAESALSFERLENARLQAVLEEYKSTFEELRTHTEGVEWLGRELNTMEGTAEVLDRLQRKVNSADFLKKLQDPRFCEGVASLPAGATRITTKDGVEVNVDVDDPSWWLWVSDVDVCGTPRTEASGLGDGDEDEYIVLDRDDVVDGVADFVARFLSTHPQTENMTPKELQETISYAFTELQMKGTIRKLWDWGKFLYAAGSWTATAVGIYRNPLLIRATLLAIWTSCRLILQLLK